MVPKEIITRYFDILDYLVITKRHTFNEGLLYCLKELCSKGYANHYYRIDYAILAESYRDYFKLESVLYYLGLITYGAYTEEGIQLIVPNKMIFEILLRYLLKVSEEHKECFTEDGDQELLERLSKAVEEENWGPVYKIDDVK